MTSAADLAEELNNVAEYARVDIEFAVQDGPEPGQATVTVDGEDFVVDLSWAMGNTKRLPDRTNRRQILQALTVSHPDVKGVGPKNPEK